MRKLASFALLLLFIPSFLAAHQHPGNKLQYVECLIANVTQSATLGQEVTDCLATPVNALYLDVYLNPRSGDSSLWAFSFHSYFVVVDVTKNYINLLSFGTLSLNLCMLRVTFENYCNATAYGFNEAEERNLVGTFLFNQYIVNNRESIQLGIIKQSSSSDSSSDSPPTNSTSTTSPSSTSSSSTTSSQKSKIMTVEQSAYLCQLSSPSSRSSLLSPSYCCKNDINSMAFVGGNVTLYPVACPLQNSSSKKPTNYFVSAIIISAAVAIVVVFSNIEYMVPVFYTWWDPVIHADTTVPLFWGKPGEQRVCTNHVAYVIAYVIKFLIFSFPILWGAFSTVTSVTTGFLVGAVIMTVALYWILHVSLLEDTQKFILQNIPRPLFAITLLRKSFKKTSKYSTRSRPLLILFYAIPSICVLLYAFLLIFWSTVIIFFVICGVAANTNEAIATVSLVIALCIVLKTEYTIVRRPVLRVKVLLMNKEELKGMTWGHVYTLLEKLHWLPMDIVKRRLPLYVALGFVLSLIYFALRMFSDSKQVISNVIFQSVMMLVVGYIPSLLDREDYDEYTMFEVYKELGFKSIEEDLKSKTFTNPKQKRSDIQNNDEENEKTSKNRKDKRKEKEAEREELLVDYD